MRGLDRSNFSRLFHDGPEAEEEPRNSTTLNLLAMALASNLRTMACNLLAMAYLSKYGDSPSFPPDSLIGYVL